MAAPVLALIGAMAVACFVKLYGMVFLGTFRSDHSRHAHESGLCIVGPMFVLAMCCFGIGLAPTLFVPVLAKAVSAWAPELNDVEARLTELAPLDRIGSLSQVLVAGLAATSLLLWIRLRTSPVERGSTWGCGFVAPTPRIQYTSSSFAEMLVTLFGWALRPRTERPKILALFPQQTRFQSEIQDPVLDEAVLPTFHIAADKLTWFRVFQQGRIQTYLVYIFGALLALLLW